MIKYYLEYDTRLMSRTYRRKHDHDVSHQYDYVCVRDHPSQALRIVYFKKEGAALRAAI